MSIRSAANRRYKMHRYLVTATYYASHVAIHVTIIDRARS